ncbi:asparagine synthase (glutamine-hydrolyzing) [Allofournierella sp.]|uniref:asparagine synthase (glutamine-hydrolyzing) n=1 Tax=Allofournierella sp. TaxID=1940256 RepID=UPI002E7782C0|nr:asparagine synthase (glutamine-hydrolyzing) [Fournierella sp.]MEE0757795.1 asparagine synthase (glutamine-hydrolyzing) [Fournierella sp.]
MCGITGFVCAKHELEEAKKTLKAMADLIAHRGPDGEGFYVDEQAALGHRRLSIIDLEGGSQPMFNEDKNLVTVFNGEIYNFMELREQLTAAGHVFATHSDTEVLLHGYEEWGEALPEKLRGMFAFVIWDKANRTLFGARDIFGIKPFYYYQNEDLLLFGSEIKTFLPHPSFVKELNEERLPEYLSIEYIPNAETMFKNVYKLPGAHRFTFKDGKLTVSRYYDIAYHVDHGKTLEDWKKAIADTFAESVRVHQIADVEVGCFLSSGVDSSFVVNEVAKGTPHVKSFSVGYEEEKYSELPYAQAFSKEIGVPSIANKVNADEFFEANQTIQWYLDEPMPNPSEVPLYFLTKNAARYVKVVLSGEGADELFGGYPLYCAAHHFEEYGKIPRPLRKGAGAVAMALPEFKGRHFLMRGAQEPWQRCMRANYVFASPAERDKYLKKDYRAKAPEEYFKPYFDHVKDLDEPTQLQWVDIHTWMLYDILLKADRMSMANSLELRVPFLDREMLELALSIPVEYRSSKSETKIALRAAALEQLPESVAKRRKLGFPVPLNDWLRQDKYYNMVREKFEGPVAEKFFNVPELLKLLDAHKAGKNGGMTQIWSFYSFILWYELFFVQR